MKLICSAFNLSEKEMFEVLSIVMVGLYNHCRCEDVPPGAPPHLCHDELKVVAFIQSLGFKDETRDFVFYMVGVMVPDFRFWITVFTQIEHDMKIPGIDLYKTMAGYMAHTISSLRAPLN
jgi:hypothetical protein